MGGDASHGFKAAGGSEEEAAVAEEAGPAEAGLAVRGGEAALAREEARLADAGEEAD
jgi:hypothetical protein